MSGAVLVRLTARQREELRSVAAAELDAYSTASRTLEQAVAALDAGVPELTYAQWSGLVGATADAESLAEDYEGGALLAWRSTAAATSRALRALHKLHGWKGAATVSARR